MVRARTVSGTSNQSPIFLRSCATSATPVGLRRVHRLLLVRRLRVLLAEAPAQHRRSDYEESQANEDTERLSASYTAVAVWAFGDRLSPPHPFLYIEASYRSSSSVRSPGAGPGSIPVSLPRDLTTIRFVRPRLIGSRRGGRGCRGSRRADRSLRSASACRRRDRRLCRRRGSRSATRSAFRFTCPRMRSVRPS